MIKIIEQSEYAKYWNGILHHLNDAVTIAVTREKFLSSRTVENFLKEKETIFAYVGLVDDFSRGITIAQLVQRFDTPESVEVAWLGIQNGLLVSTLGILLKENTILINISPENVLQILSSKVRL